MEIGGRSSFPRNTLGTATINIVLDHLSDFEIVSTPENPNRTVSWCSAPLPPDKQAPYDDRVTLYVIEASDAEELFAQRSHAIGLIALQQDEPFSPDAPPFPADLLRQLVIVRSKTPISKTKLLGAVMSTVYSCLFSIREWAANLAGIVSREGTIQELIDESEQLFDNFIDVNDSTYSLIARTKKSSPPIRFRPSSCAWAATISTPSKPQSRSAPSENGAIKRRSMCSGRTRPFRSSTSRAF
ncbi:hypothetical protein [Ellagibacter isourolithinifaciens]|uniref:hypothetical protein n=1 Tax=Ellagibacter isourolithinifaciens TaxID=2137581 RepID=UPI003A929612